MRIRPILICLMAACFTFSCSSNRQLAENTASSTITNVQINQVDEIVTIHYDLIDDAEDSRYYVQLMLEFENNQYYAPSPESLTGDVGADIAPGSEKVITWNVTHDFPQGLRSDQIQFAFDVRLQTGDSNNGWIFAAAGLMAISVGIAAAIVLNRGGNSTGLPAPPSRPGF